ncbi:KilA-N domain-containing protein [Raoultella ornithinolytica]|uniref:KilA-N domain-containing protein n=1 Tax=Raoultella ornithinolytica TaxID=54291 RepID=UPI0025B32107|nr:KilA-N domain-containing protein [Raoultella ornithinolytica]MDN3781139.1 KilA-N domain-containing protein [Raoultella ornithinolytica]
MTNHVMGAAASNNHSFFVIDGISVRRDVLGRYCLNDLHRASGSLDRHKPAFWLRNEQTAQLIGELQNSNSDVSEPVSVIRGGNEQGTYVCRELVYAYAMWISAVFNLKVIRTFDALHTAGAVTVNSDRIQAGVILLESAARMLNLSNSSKLGAYQKLQQVAGLPDLMPSYAIDAPAGALDGSSRPTLSLSALLKANNIRMTANQAYHLMAGHGIVEQKERRSRTGINGVKRFWSVTPKGCLYGKNITSPANPRETQPYFFESKFPELLKLLGTVSQ